VGTIPIVVHTTTENIAENLPVVFVTNPKVMELLKKYIEKINWHYLSVNPVATSFLLENMDNIDWPMFSMNTSDEAVMYLREHPQRIVWDKFQHVDRTLNIND